MPDTQVLGIIATAVIGAVGIVATHVYHVRGNQAQRTIFKKLPGAIVEILKQDLREKLSIQELNELIHQKSVDEDAGEQGDSLPYKACPHRVQRMQMVGVDGMSQSQRAVLPLANAVVWSVVRVGWR